MYTTCANVEVRGETGDLRSSTDQRFDPLRTEPASVEGSNVLMVPLVAAVLGTPQARASFACAIRQNTTLALCMERVVGQLTFLTERLDSRDPIRCQNTLPVNEVFCL